MEEQRALLAELGLTEKELDETQKNAKLSAALADIVKTHELDQGRCSKERGALVKQVATTLPASAAAHRPLLINHIKEGKIATNDQCTAAIKYLKAHANEAELDIADFDRACGVGVTVSDSDIEAAVAEVMRTHEAAIREERYHFNLMKLVQPIKQIGDMAWADIGKVKAQLDAQAARMLGPKTREDEQPRAKPKKAKGPPKATPKAATSGNENAAPANGVTAESEATLDPYRFLPAPEENTCTHVEVSLSNGEVMRFCNSKEQLARHLKETGSKVVTRFPPEPNGYLHIGHAKAMFVDFGMAKQRGGKCYLRFDDTNPEAESKEYIDHIKEIVSWMGWQYCQVTHSSDYFDQLHAFAVQLIRDGKAYVCHQTGDEIKATREVYGMSPWRDRPTEESLRLFEDMRRGLYDEGTATLRLRMDPANANRNMDDLVAYRIKFAPHPHVGSKWCIYPSYDFTHCIVDSLEQITHSLCTLEFETRRASYYWLLNALGLYMPLVWEYSRLNLTHNVMSKRKLQVLVTGNHVRGWDDPRLPTLAGMRRRGISPEGINLLCHEMGITRSDNEIPLHKLYHHVRTHLDETSPRALAVLRPLRLVITNLPEDHLEHVRALDFPGRGDQGYDVPFSRVCYIEATDFRTEDSKDYFGLAPGKSIMLRYAYPVTYEAHDTAADGSVSEVRVTYDRDFRSKGKPPKGVVNWVAQPRPGVEPHTAEARLYTENLFKSESPGEAEDWLADMATDSEEVLRRVYVSPRLKGCAPLERFQLERLGFFCVDRDTTADRLVLNRTCTLRDSYIKKR